MAINFNDMKRNRKADFEKLQKKIDDENKGGFGASDERFWSPGKDKAGNGYALLRLLPAPAGEDFAHVRYWEHGFKGPTGKWYIELSRTTINEKDPVSEFNSELWNSSTDDEGPERKQVRNQKRKLSYISNVYIIKDASNPENEGKVFLYRYGKKIWDKINAMMYPPEIEQRAGVNPFDLWEGANFKLKIRKVAGYTNYDSSEFDRPEPLFDDDEKMEAVWKQEYPLQEHVAAAKFKSYDELKKQFESVMGIDDSAPKSKPSEQAKTEYKPRDRTTAAPSAPSAKAEEHVAANAGSSVDEDDDLAYFEKLANS